MWWRRSESSRFFPRYSSHTQNRGIATSDYTQPAIKKRQPFSKTSMKWITLFALTQTNIVSSAGLALLRPAEHLHAKLWCYCSQIKVPTKQERDGGSACAYPAHSATPPPDGWPPGLRGRRPHLPLRGLHRPCLHGLAALCNCSFSGQSS